MAPAALDPLDQLPLQLIHIGKVFRGPQRGDARAVLRARATIHQAIPRADRLLHEALDEIEVDLLKAKSVLERDLAALRAKRAEREKTEGVSRLLASRPPSPPPQRNSPSATREAPHDGMAVVDEGPPKASKGSVPAPAPLPAPRTLLPTGQASDGRARSRTSLPRRPASVDLDSPAGAGRSTLGLAFSPTKVFDPTAGRSDDNFANVKPSGGEDIDSLLPGFESYVDADAGAPVDVGAAAGTGAAIPAGADDFDMTDLGGGNVDFGNDVDASAGPNAGRKARGGPMAEHGKGNPGSDAPQPSNFDMCFDDMDGGDGSGGMVNMDDLDDWFKMDGS